MHETALMQNLIATVMQVAENHKVVRVNRWSSLWEGFQTYCRMRFRLPLRP